MLTLLKSRYYNIGYKKRVSFLVLLGFIFLLVVASEYFRVDFSDIRSVHRAFSGRGSRSNFDWDGWVKRNNFLSIGDVYDMCDTKSGDRIKVGKAVLSSERGSKKILATLAANITLADDLVHAKANIYASYRGRVLYNETYDVCKDLGVKNIKCPMKKGQLISIHESKFFPSHIPKGYFVAVGRVVNQNNKCLGLIEAEFEI